ncbi:C-C motif chemokine 2-like isoform X1 [Polypterus senegalus]|uniref:C-C motif chemokine 2-like isoform X1 n=1 Tax=Polypterus senegalus TaxID=55291 RepID=UPI001963B350|nr:C-C motif chemokine 2-like isoform X1 [Polypterus senegalus]
MKSHFLIVVGLFGIVNSQLFSHVNLPLSCCFRFLETPIPRQHVVGYKTTRDDCPRQGVIFITANTKREVCANPEDAWVVKYMNYFDRLAAEPEVIPRRKNPFTTARGRMNQNDAWVKKNINYQETSTGEHKATPGVLSTISPASKTDDNKSDACFTGLQKTPVQTQNREKTQTDFQTEFKQFCRMF